MAKTYVDEIVGGDGKRRYNIVDDGGNIVVANVQIEKAYIPTQEGTLFGAEDINNLQLQADNLQSQIEALQTVSGSNANGSYTKFADGTMICRVRKVATMGINTPHGAVFVGNFVWEYPQPFSSAGDLVVAVGECALAGSGAMSAETRNVSASSAQLNFYDSISRAAGTSITYSASAIGRWK